MVKFRTGDYLHTGRSIKMITIKKVIKNLASVVASFMGSWWSVIGFIFIISFWMLLNTLPITTKWHIDAFPYQFLNLILGIIAALTGPLVLIGNSSQEKRYQGLIESIYNMEKKEHKILETIYEMEKKQTSFFTKEVPKE